MACGAVAYLALVRPSPAFFLPAMVALYTVGLHGSRRRALAVAAGLLPSTVLIVLLSSPDDGDALQQILQELSQFGFVLAEEDRWPRRGCGKCAQERRSAASCGRQSSPNRGSGPKWAAIGSSEANEEAECTASPLTSCSPSRTEPAAKATRTSTCNCSAHYMTSGTGMLAGSASCSFTGTWSSISRPLISTASSASRPTRPLTSILVAPSRRLDRVDGGVADSQSLQELIAYSTAIEGWHNEAHMVVGMANGIDLMNPRTNVFLPQFWNLHFFINARLEEHLTSYAAAVHPARALARGADPTGGPVAQDREPTMGPSERRRGALRGRVTDGSICLQRSLPGDRGTSPTVLRARPGASPHEPARVVVDGDGQVGLALAPPDPPPLSPGPKRRRSQREN